MATKISIVRSVSICMPLQIHKVIDPLFLDDLKAELDEIKAVKVKKTRENKLNEYRNKLASLMFLDPACGSGNFLTETYLSLRKLENKTIKQLVVIDGHVYGQSMIAESQMMKETEEIIDTNLDFLPLKSYANIVGETLSALTGRALCLKKNYPILWEIRCLWAQNIKVKNKDKIYYYLILKLKILDYLTMLVVGILKHQE